MRAYSKLFPKDGHKLYPCLSPTRMCLDVFTIANETDYYYPSVHKLTGMMIRVTQTPFRIQSKRMADHDYSYIQKYAHYREKVIWDLYARDLHKFDVYTQ